MKLILFLRDKKETWSAVVHGGVVDLAEKSGHPTLVSFIASSDFDRRDRLVAGLKPEFSLGNITYLPTIPRPEKIVCAVRNYMDHHNEAIAAGLKRELSDFPPILLRVWRAQIGHLQPMIRPRVSESLD